MSDILRVRTGEIITIGSTSAEEFAVVATLPPGLAGPPPHRHRVEQETFTVLEGVLRVRIGDERRDLDAGESVVVPPGVVHAFGNPADRAVRIAVRETPAGQLEHQLRAGGGRPAAPDPDARRAELHGLPEAPQRLLWRLLARAARLRLRRP